MKTSTLQWNPIDCAAWGICAEELPELIALDEWGYPQVPSGPLPADLVRRAKTAAARCPVLALKVQSRSAAVSRT